MAILTVGPGQQYATISAAVTAASSGDDIQVQAGTYTNDFPANVNNLTIEGVGGMAHIVATKLVPNGKAEFVTSGTVTLRSLEVSGMSVKGVDKNGAAVRYQSGTLSLDHVYFHNNQEGLLADGDPNGMITIKSSEFAFNGSNGLTHNIYINNVGTTNVDNSYIHDVLGNGSEFRSRGANTTITNTRIVDLQNADNYTVDLPAGGQVLLQNDVFEKAARATNEIMIHYSPDQQVPWHTPSSLTVNASTFINDYGSKAIGIYNINGPGVSNGGPVAITAQVTNNTVYNLDASHFIIGPANETGTTRVATRPTIDTSHPWQTASSTSSTASPALDPPTADPPEGPATNDTVVLNIIAGPWQGASQFLTKVDGIQEGGVNTVTASHSTGDSQSFIFTGDFGPGLHDVAISFLGNTSGPGGGGNLYVNSIDYDGTHYGSASAVISSDQTAHFMVGTTSQ